MNSAASTQIASSVAATQDLGRPASRKFEYQSKERSRRYPLTGTPEQQRCIHRVTAVSSATESSRCTTAHDAHCSGHGGLSSMVERRSSVDAPTYSSEQRRPGRRQWGRTARSKQKDVVAGGSHSAGKQTNAGGARRLGKGQRRW